MNVVWHIVRKDLVRLRVTLLLWTVVLSSHLVLATIASRLDQAGFQPFYIGALVFGAVFLPCFAFGVVMGVIQDDSLSGPDPFWVTRPISGAQLLFAKLVVLTLLAIFPALVLAPWWGWQGFDAEQFATAFEHTFWWNASIMLLAVPIAAVANSTGRFVMGGIIVAVSFAMLEFFSSVAAGTRLFNDRALDQGSWCRVIVLTWFAAGAIATIHQFVTRRTRRSILLLALFSVAGVSYSFLAQRPPVRSITDFGGDAASDRAPNFMALPATLHASAREHGERLEVVEITPDFTRGLVVTVSDSKADFTFPSWMKKTPDAAPAKPVVMFFLAGRDDGRSVRGAVGRIEGDHTGAAIHFRRTELVFNARGEWNRDPSFDFGTWAKSALLVKVTAASELDILPPDVATALTHLTP